MYLNIDLLYLIKDFYCSRCDYYHKNYTDNFYTFEKVICGFCDLETICMDCPWHYFNCRICFPCIKSYFVLNKLNF